MTSFPTHRIPAHVVVQGNFQHLGNGPEVIRSQIRQELARYVLPWSIWTKHDEPFTRLPGTPASSDLGLVGTTFGTNVPAISAGDLKSAGATTRYARCQWQLPPEFDEGQTFLLQANAGMADNVADNTATIDFEVFKADRAGGKSGTDLIDTAAQSINSTSFAELDFTVLSATLAPGDWIDIRLTIAVNDAATGDPVTALAGEIAALLDIRG